MTTASKVCKLINELPRCATGVYIMPDTVHTVPSDVDNIFNALDITANMVCENQMCISDRAVEEKSCLIDLHSLIGYEQTSETLELHMGTGQVICFMIYPLTEGSDEQEEFSTDRDVDLHIAHAYAKEMGRLTEECKANQKPIEGDNESDRLTRLTYEMYRAGFYYGVDTALIIDDANMKKDSCHACNACDAAQSDIADGNGDITTQEEIRAYLDRRGLTVADLANMIYMGTDTLEEYLSGKRNMSLSTFMFICTVLGKQPDTFMKPKRTEARA